MAGKLKGIAVSTHPLAPADVRKIPGRRGGLPDLPTLARLAIPCDGSSVGVESPPSQTIRERGIGRLRRWEEEPVGFPPGLVSTRPEVFLRLRAGHFAAKSALLP